MLKTGYALGNNSDKFIVINVAFIFGFFSIVIMPAARSLFIYWLTLLTCSLRSYAISNTINLKEDVTAEDVKNIYITAYTEGLKGITIFRDNSIIKGPKQLTRND